MANLIKMTIQFRRDTAANWELYKDKVPAAGEPCFVIDKNILKIGDGVTSFGDLPAIGGVEISTDGKSLVLEDGALKLLGFEDAKEGAYPIKNADGVIEWVMPSTEAVDGLQAIVTGLQTNVNGLQTDVAGLKAIIGSTDDGTGTLLERIESLEGKVGKEDVDTKIDAAINKFVNDISDDGTVNTLKELVDYVAEHDDVTTAIVKDIDNLKTLVGSDPIGNQIAEAIKNSGHMSKTEAEATLLSKVEAKATYERVKYEIADTPAGTLVDYRDKEIRVMCPANAVFTKQSVGAGGNVNKYYMTFKTYVPNDNIVGYIEHLGDQADAEILTSFSTDKYGRRYQPTWLSLAEYDEATDTWTYSGKNSTTSKYIGWDYQIDWYDADGVMVASDCVRINLSNEDCHHNTEPYCMGKVVKGVSVNGTLLDMVDGKVDIAINNVIKTSDEIEVAEDGSLRIKAISFDKVMQAEDQEIVLSGGGAAG